MIEDNNYRDVTLISLIIMFSTAFLLITGCKDNDNDSASDSQNGSSVQSQDAATNVKGDAGSGSDLCADGYPRGQGSMESTVIHTFTPSPEGVTVCPSGEVFVSLYDSGEIWRITDDGSSVSLYTTLQSRKIAGLTCDDQSRIFAADFGDPESGIEPGCVRVDYQGHEGSTLPTTAEGEPFEDPNGIVFVPGKGIYMSDSQKGIIVFFQEKENGDYLATIADSGDHIKGAIAISGVNGLTYHAEANKLYAVVSLDPALYSYTIESDGSLTEMTEMKSAEVESQEHMFDGVIVDEEMDVYIASYLKGEVIRFSDGESIVSWTNAASLAFRGGTLYVTSFFFDATQEGGLLAIDLGICSGTY